MSAALIYPVRMGLGLGREVEGVRKDGERIELYLAVSEYFVGGKRHFTGVMRDIREHVHIMNDSGKPGLKRNKPAGPNRRFWPP
jgi:hypothetical protein